jgi:hypothetical protein
MNTAQHVSRDDPIIFSEPSDIWVSPDDVADILMLTGIEATEASVGEAVKHLGKLLPDFTANKICFQVKGLTQMFALL